MHVLIAFPDIEELHFNLFECVQHVRVEMVTGFLQYDPVCGVVGEGIFVHPFGCECIIYIGKGQNSS